MECCRHPRGAGDSTAWVHIPAPTRTLINIMSATDSASKITTISTSAEPVPYITAGGWDTTSTSSVTADTVSTSSPSIDVVTAVTGAHHGDLNVYFWIDEQGSTQATSSPPPDGLYTVELPRRLLARGKVAMIQRPEEPLLEFVVGEGGQLPTRGTDGAVGYDLYASEQMSIPVGNRVLVNTALKWKGIKGHALIIKDRSSWAWKCGVETAAGVIDWDYRGEIKVLVRNSGEFHVFIKKGERIAQFLLVPVLTPTPKQISAEELNESTRGEGGFGSTGK